MSEQSPFRSERDLELGALLEDAFVGPAPEAFLARIEGAVSGLPRRPSEWDVLAGWARGPVLVAAAVAGFLLGLSLWRGWQSRAASPSVGTPSVSVAMLEPVRADEPILYTVLEAR
jgi:hypothetical protein